MVSLLRTIDNVYRLMALLSSYHLSFKVDAWVPTVPMLYRFIVQSLLVVQFDPGETFNLAPNFYSNQLCLCIGLAFTLGAHTIKLFTVIVYIFL